MRRTLVTLSLICSGLLVTQESATAASECITRSEIKKIVQKGPSRKETVSLLGWEGRYEGRKFSSYRRCGYSWNEKTVVLGYVNGRVWFVTTVSQKEV